MLGKIREQCVRPYRRPPCITPRRRGLVEASDTQEILSRAAIDPIGRVQLKSRAMPVIVNLRKWASFNDSEVTAANGRHIRVSSDSNDSQDVTSGRMREKLKAGVTEEKSHSLK